jgi:hypothetical protein
LAVAMRQDVKLRQLPSSFFTTSNLDPLIAKLLVRSEALQFLRSSLGNISMVRRQL